MNIFVKCNLKVAKLFSEMHHVTLWRLVVLESLLNSTHCCLDSTCILSPCNAVRLVARDCEKNTPLSKRILNLGSAR